MSYFLARTQGLNFVHIYKKICVFKYYKYQYNSDRLLQIEKSSKKKMFFSKVRKFFKYIKIVYNYEVKSRIPAKNVLVYFSLKCRF